MAEGDEAYEDIALITILGKGDQIEYVVPSFPVLSGKLMETKLQ